MTDPTDAEVLAMAQLANSTEALIKLQHFAPVIERANELAPELADALMKHWANDSDPLIKGLAQHWLDRARATVEQGVKPAKPDAPKRKIVHPLIAQAMARHAARHKPMNKAFDVIS